ncbi:DUF11 domain-containing protein [Acinetobacter sp. SwsAc6]|uniref:DUF11 domain-containing protein n=1 Tax=Acinetobacter sp. SwsAc6 TaxID=2749439 RepID=UPI0015BAAE16|nr:DUF11 domain-containing protein [Acinetobacter sp. SwsAc6]NWK74566.1 DUF11 domain-containing protein [Acinetobacter sp. SwsAc6]
MTLLFSSSLYAFPLPGSYISNIASGDYVDETGSTLVVNSNPVSLEVQKILALTLVQNQQQQSTIGGLVNFPHVLTNTGNTSDRYALSLTHSVSDEFDLASIKVYADRDQNGVPDDNVDLLLPNSSIDLKAGESLSIVAVGTVPSSVLANQKSIFELKATSQTTNTIDARVNDTVVVVDDAVISVVKAQDKSQGNEQELITYTLTYRNNGTDTAKLTLTDLLDDSLQYVKESAHWNQNSIALTDSNDTENTINSGISYQLLSDQKTLQAEIQSVPPLTSGTLSFQVRVKNTDKNKIPNTAKYTYVGEKSKVPYNQDSNTVHYTLLPSLGVVLNNNPNSNSDAGNPNKDPDNLSTINELKPGKQVFFQNYVWNKGNITDVYNLSYSTANLPECAQVRLYHKDGKTLLTDTNGDGIVDTGSLASSAVKEIRVAVLASTSCNTEKSNIVIDVVATSVLSSDISNPTRNVITKLVASSSESDLYNSDNSGKDVGKIDNNGNAWLKKSVLDGKVVFPLIAENKSTQSNNYNLFASFSAMDMQNISVVTASGFTVKFYEGDATCSNLGKQITNTGTMAAAATKAYCAVIQVDASQQNFVKPIWFAIQSPVNQQADVIKNEISSSTARQLILSNDQQGQVSVGGTIVYVHTLKNTGTITEGADQGSVVKLKVNPQKLDDNFIYSLYYDVNKDGKIDPSDKFIDANTDLNSLSAGLGIAPDRDIQILLKVQAPVTATHGVVSVADLIVEAGTFANIKLENLKNTDVTTVSTSAMQLLKYQVKAPTCTMTFDPANVTSLSFSAQPLIIKPNECVIYKLEVENRGSSIVTNVQFQDAVPAYTTLVGTPFLVPAGVNASTAASIKGTIASLSSGQMANMYFMIRVNP